MKIDFKLESDGVWRAYAEIYACHVWDIDMEEWDMLYAKEGYLPVVWVPVAASRKKDLCVRLAKERVNEVPHYFKTSNNR